MSPPETAPTTVPARSRWSWGLGRIAGIEIRVHATFLLLLLWVGFGEYHRGGSAGGAVQAMSFLLAVFASVVLHEYGHALTAAKFGVRTREIILLPIGGVARLERMPERPSQELAIAAAGPLVTIFIIAVLWVVLRLTGTPMTATESLSGKGPFLAALMWINITLAVFNLLPAFPMDGGRVLRSIIALRTDFARATEIATRIGQVFALVFAAIGLFVTGNPFLVLIAVFVWVAASAEAAETRLRAAVAGIPVTRVMIADVQRLAPEQPLAMVIQHVIAGFQNDFPVVQNDRVVGVLTRSDLLRALAEGRQSATVGEIMNSSFASAHPNEMLDVALARLNECRCQTLPVIRDDTLLGVVTMESIGELVAIESALRTARKRG
jgi:Zn-dependent protease/predicted transcriptional regulator